MSAVEISVIVCTRNRAASLEQMLASAARLAIPEDLSWEMLIIDNGSTDETAEIVAGFEGRLPIRRVAEPSPGLSNARNRGVAEARGAYICWADDDLTLDPDWLLAYREAFGRHPQAALFGGRILPRLEPGGPLWFQACLDDWPLASLTARRDPQADAPISADDLPWGANFAVRTAEQRLLRYDPALGLSPEHGRIGEESDLMRRLLARGAEGRWVTKSLVWHCIGPERQTRDHFLSYFRAAGETAAFLRQRGKGAPVLSLAVWSSPLLAVIGEIFLLVSLLAGAVGLPRLSLRFLARRALCDGVLAHRRMAAAQARSEPQGAVARP